MPTFDTLIEQLITWDQHATLCVNGSDSLFLDGVAKIATSTFTWIPVALALIYVIIRHNNLKETGLIFLAIGICVLISDQVASGICKPFFARYRPAQDPLLMYAVDIVDGYRGGRYGFFSSHASNTFSVAVFVSLLIRHRALTFGLFSWALLNCWTRLYLGVHYLGDILVGILLGVLVGFSIYALFRKLQKSESEPTYRSEIQTSTGYGIEYSYLILAVLLATYIFILSYALCWE